MVAIPDGQGILVGRMYLARTQRHKNISQYKKVAGFLPPGNNPNNVVFFSPEKLVWLFLQMKTAVTAGAALVLSRQGFRMQVGTYVCSTCTVVPT